jgi:hypothetical protein
VKPTPGWGEISATAGLKPEQIGQPFCASVGFGT